METIWSIIVETVILFLFEYPGAMIRWALLRGKRPFKEILYDDSFPNCADGYRHCINNMPLQNTLEAAKIFAF